MPKAVVGQGLTEQVDFKKWAQSLCWVGEAKSKLPFFSRKAKIYLFSMSFPNLPRRGGVGWEEEGVLERRNTTCKCRQSEDVRGSASLVVAGLSFAELSYSTWNALFHTHLWTVGWLFLMWTRQPFSGLLYSWPCFPRAIYSLWVITTMAVTILLNGWGLMFLTLAWTQ